MDRSHTLPLKNKVTYLPGRRCLFYRHHHCLYEEGLNPGLHADLQCRLLKELQKSFDAFVDRAERFRLDDRTAGRIWKQTSRRLCTTASCARYREDPDRDDEACMYLHGNACVLLFPLCSRICARFRPRETAPLREGHPSF